MLKNKYVLHIVVCIILVLGCASNFDTNIIIANNHIDKYSNNISIIATKINEYDLDDESINLIDYLGYQELDTVSVLSILTKFNNSIYFYDSNDKQFIRKIKVDVKSIGKIQGYHYVSDDSIFVYSYSKGYVFGIDSNSNIFCKHKISSYPRNSDRIIYPYTYLQTPAPLVISEHNILSVGFVTGETDLETYSNRPVVSIFSMDSNSQRFVVNYPEQYKEYNWGGSFTYRMPYFCYNNNELIISFPASHELIKYSIATKRQSSYYSGSAIINGIKPFHIKKSIDDKSFVWSWYMSNPSYEGVFYDKYRNLYYRIARLPDTNYKDGERGNNKPVVVIVMDSKLEYLGEVALSRDM